MSAGRAKTIDPGALPRHFDSAAAERRWDEAWQKAGIYHYDPSRPRRETYVVDTPPPTASGTLHPGHVFSYTHTDIVVRYRRMRGMNVFYPMGWDDNGLPTERRVQNYFHVRCDPKARYERDLALSEASAKDRKGPPRRVSRPNFIELCEHVTLEDERAFMELWRRLGLSVDWRQEYRTVDAHCRRVAQLSFRDLWEKEQAYTLDAPTMWDVDFQCAIAQAEAEDRLRPGAFHDIEFGVEGSDESFVVSTTRPELLAACVGVTAHPDDARYRKLFGRRAVTPLFRVPVPIFPSEAADPEKGTGILMVCTFGDATDVVWWREHGLALRQLVTPAGRLAEVRFGAPGFESLDAETANRCYAELSGKTISTARAAVVELLRRPEGAATAGGRAPLRAEPRGIEHAVKFYERGERPLEFVPTRQWFVRLLDHKEALLARGREIAWYPSHMGKRYEDWTRNLAFDWSVSRQRFFGVPIPVWYPLDARGEPDYDNPIVAEVEELPVDPTTDAPPGFCEDQRDAPGGFRGDPDVFDTWFTSSLTPQISSHWGTDPERHRALYPADVRPQGQDIIRTWAFYTIVKSHLHEGRIPWREAAISGFILDPERKKMSKSKGNVVTPLPLIDRYGADGVRYWSGSARLGVDTALDEQVFKVGKRLVTKIFNASKFVLAQAAAPRPITGELERAFLAELRALVATATEALDRYDHAHALMHTESFFWGRFTDTTVELLKRRAATEDDPEGSGSAVAALRLALSVQLRLFAPFLPYVTEEVWSWAFAEETGMPSIHGAPWPEASEFSSVPAPADPSSLQVAIAALSAIHKAKADAEVSMARGAESLTLAAHPETLARFPAVAADVLAASRCVRHRLEPDASLEPQVFRVIDLVPAPREEAVEA